MSVTIAEAASHLARIEKARSEAARKRADDFRERLPMARRLLDERYGARRIVLFGSLASGEPGPDCDVDLAVEGLEPKRYFDALADLQEIFRAGVDLVRIEEALPSLRLVIDSEGIPL